MKFSIPIAVTLLLSLSAARARADVVADLKKATDEGHPVFLVVTDAAAKGTELAMRVSNEAAAIVGDAVVVRLDRGDPAAAAVVKRYRVESVPVPLILVIGANGVAAAGAKPTATTAGKLALLVPSPAKGAFLKALDEGKPTFIVFSRTAMPNRIPALAACDVAVKTLKGVGAVVSVDMDDAKEAAFGAEMQVDPASKDVVTVVMNAKGKRAVAYVGVPISKSLVDATVIVATGGCGCGPEGCK